MKLQLDGQYFIKTDENNFILCEVKWYGEDSKNYGDCFDFTVGYYGTMELALKGFLKHAIRNATYGGQEIKTVEEMLAKLESINEKIVKALKQIEKGK